MADIRLENVVKSYDGKHPVVRGVTLSMPDGKVTTLLGPSGCGKSTLLRLVAGLERPDAGEVCIGKSCVNRLEPRERDVAMVFQSYALYPHMTVFNNIAVALRLRRMARDEIRARVESAAEKLGIAQYLDRRPKELSGGERQRVALARALVRRPQVFLLDEPLSNLDAVLRERTRGELRSLFRQLGATVIYVTHDQVEAMSLSDRVAVIQAGQVEQVGTPEEIYARPATLFTAGFVGSPRMNFLPGDTLPGGAHTLGIRPEDVDVKGEGPLELDVGVRELLGAQQLVTLRRGKVELKVLLPAGQALPSSIRVRIDPACAHFFNAQGRRVML